MNGKSGINKSMILAGIIALSAVAVEANEEKEQPTVRPSSSNIKDLQMRGRVQAQFGYVHAKNDEISEDWSTFELRRVRLGMRGTLFDNFRAQVEANLVPGSDLSMRSAFIEWREHRPAYVKLGFDKPRFGFEENTSSAEILTVERTLINNTLAPGAQNGLSVSGSFNMFAYSAGLYTDMANRNKDQESSKYLYNASIGVKLDELLGEKVRLRADYLNSDDEDGAFGKGFKDAVSVSIHLGKDRFDLRGEYMRGVDRDSETTHGGYVMPSMFILADKLQGVLRFETMKSDNSTGIRASSRYTRRVPGLEHDKGDSYMAGYAGLNYYFAGNQHKLMLGVELAELKNTEQGNLQSTTALGAWRMLF